MKQDFRECLSNAGYRVGRNTAFCDFLTLAVCALSAQEKEKEYLEIIKKYDEKEIKNFADAFTCLVLEMDNNGNGLMDCLGDYYMDFLADSRKGQFFTPEVACDFMAQILCPQESENFIDPCCGSGRFALSAAKINRDLKFYCADIDYQCCQMTLINMCLNGLYGSVSHRNSLTNEEWHRWKVSIHHILRVPFIYEFDLNQEIEEKNEFQKDLFEEVEEVEEQETTQKESLSEPLLSFLSEIDLM